MENVKTQDATRTLEFEQVVKRPAEQVYRAFTTDVVLREWLSNGASVNAKEGGRLVLWWSDGYQVFGRYTALEENEAVSFTWFGDNEPAETQVDVTLTANADSTTVKIVHSGLGEGEGWDELADGLTKGWEDGIENLTAVLEEGDDLRISRRPMLGFLPGNAISKDNHARYKLPVDASGIVVGNVLDDFGMKDAGVQADDVLHRIGDVVIDGFNAFGPAMQGKTAGDVVAIEYSRDGVMHTVDMTLKGRPTTDVPEDSKELAAQLKAIYDQVDTELDELLDGVTDAEADHHPEEGEWNVKQVIAHLVYTERDMQTWISTLASGTEMTAFPNNIHARNDAIVAAHPTLEDMRGLLRRTYAETVAQVAGMAREFEDKPSTYYRMGQALLQGALHQQGHYAQIRTAFEAARQ